MQNRLKELRKLKGLTQDELAEKINESQSTISNIEAGRHKTIDMQLLYKIADFFEVEPFELFIIDRTTINNSENVYSSHSQTINQFVNELIKMFREQLAIKDKQLDEKDKQIRDLINFINKMGK